MSGRFQFLLGRLARGYGHVCGQFLHVRVRVGGFGDLSGSGVFVVVFCGFWQFLVLVGAAEVWRVWGQKIVKKLIFCTFF